MCITPPIDQKSSQPPFWNLILVTPPNEGVGPQEVFTGVLRFCRTYGLWGGTADQDVKSADMDLTGFIG